MCGRLNYDSSSTRLQGGVLLTPKFEDSQKVHVMWVRPIPRNRRRSWEGGRVHHCCTEVPRCSARELSAVVQSTPRLGVIHLRVSLTQKIEDS